MLPFGHSDFFPGGVQCARFWLPFLLGYDPPEFFVLMQLCIDSAEAESKADGSLAKAENRLGKYPCSWRSGRPLAAELQKEIRAELSGFATLPLESRRTLVRFAVGMFWRGVVAAQTERQRGRRADRRIALGLNPTTAFRRAVLETLEAVGK